MAETLKRYVIVLHSTGEGPGRTIEVVAESMKEDPREYTEFYRNGEIVGRMFSNDIRAWWIKPNEEYLDS